MELLIRISLRNLLRQKRRNLLLGAAIALGMAVLVVANAFSHGISDVLFNRVMAYVAGHVTVSVAYNGNPMRALFRDGERMLDILHRAAPEASRIQEGVGVFARAIGNGQSDNIMLIGMDARPRAGAEKELADLKSNFRMLQGDYADLLRTDLENPVLVSTEKAAYLHVKAGDLLRVRFQDIHNRQQAVRLTVAGVFDPANVFMSVPVFLDLRRLKELAGYGPHDIGRISLILPDPKGTAVGVADRVHQALQPALASASGDLQFKGRTLPVTVFGFKADSASLIGFTRLVRPAFPGRDSLLKTDVLVGAALADSLGVKPGDRITFNYRSKHEPREAAAAFTVTGLLPAAEGVPANAVFVNDKDFYGFYYEHWPEAAPVSLHAASPTAADALGGGALPASASALLPYLNDEWILFDRTHTTEELQKKNREITRTKSRATIVDVESMYESASMIVKLEYALNLITLAAVLILFFIIQVGVVNTLRMTIRERTREIGTIRAIGMQRPQVRGIFLLETFFLSAFACAAGLILAFLAMAALRHITFQTGTNPLGMLLVDGHLHFKPSLVGTVAYVAFILAIAVATAWFPARRAANLPAAEALRFFE